jgi:putative DNA primase/helicase
MDERFAAARGVGLRFWREEFHEWDGAAYRRLATGELRAELAQFLAREFDRIYRRELESRDSEGGQGGSRCGDRRAPRPIAVTGRLIGDVVQAMAGLALVRTADCPAQPAWIEKILLSTERTVDGAATDLDAIPPWPPAEILPTRNALVHLPSLVAGGECATPPSPRFFNAFALDYDFDPAAPEPVQWLAFLRQVWEDDAESIDCLQEWFGYLLTPDTRHQKILMMVGPKRSGRGTIARVLKALVGANNVVNPTLSTLARPFGLASLIDKPVAVFPDARLSSRPDNAAIVECLLSISGEDDQTIDRKHMPAWTGRLPTRFVLISNELPRLRDASGALTGRLIILRFTRSFYDREDTRLFDRLSRELPGILRWAIAGWERLRRRGRFVQPRSAGDLVAAMDELASPISAFLEERCVLDPADSVPVSTLYEAWRSWCQEHGRDAIGDEQSFGRDLHAAIPGLTKSRHRKDSVRIAHYNGIRLRTPMDPDPDPDLDGPGAWTPF